MFTEYHLDMIIKAINDAEERQTNAIVKAIENVSKTITVESASGTKDIIDIILEKNLVADRVREKLRGVKFKSTPPNQDSVFNKPDDKEIEVKRKTFDKYGEVVRIESKVLEQSKKPLSKTLTTPKKPSTTKKPTGVKK